MKKYDKELMSKLKKIENEMFGSYQLTMEMFDDIIELRQLLHDKGYSLENALYISLSLMQLINGEIDGEIFNSSDNFEDYMNCSQEKINRVIENRIVSGNYTGVNRL